MMNIYSKLANTRVRIHCRSGMVLEGLLSGCDFEYESCGFLIRLEDVRVLHGEGPDRLPWVLVNPDAVDVCCPVGE
jgi:hypothetical protein